MGELSGLPSEAALERAHEALFYVGLGEARYRRLETYSLGMKQLAKLRTGDRSWPKTNLSRRADKRSRSAGRGLRMIKLIREIRDSGHAHIRVVVALAARRRECCDEIPDF
jgi:ABC-2 type transport system ATP-binding protein